jgi:MFS family permease
MSATGWGTLLRGGNAARSAVVAGGMILHALNTFIVATILPSVVRDIGGLQYFAWSTVLYVIASLLGGAVLAQALRAAGARPTYRFALGAFLVGSLLCAQAHVMPVLLAGRFVQGLGAGMLSALSFTMVRMLFPQPMWPRALSVVSVTWGVATLAGPAVGGLYAQAGAWRAAFWTMAALVPLLAILVEVALPRSMPRPTGGRGPLPVTRLLLLAGSVLAVSVGSMSPRGGINALGLAVALTGLAVFARRESRAERGLFPRGATNPSAPLAATYAAMILLMAGTTTEIFVPYFLQTLHGFTPLHAGYLSAVMAGGWTLGSVVTSGASSASARAALSGGPVLLAVGLAGLALLMPPQTEGVAPVLGLGLSLLAVGFGIGLTWPHLGARVFGFAEEADRELAGASITMVVMVGGAFGSALAGMVTNLAGLSTPGGVAGAHAAAAWLFGLFILAPLLAAAAIRRLPVQVHPASVS